MRIVGESEAEIKKEIEKKERKRERKKSFMSDERVLHHAPPLRNTGKRMIRRHRAARTPANVHNPQTQRAILGKH